MTKHTNEEINDLLIENLKDDIEDIIEEKYFMLKKDQAGFIFTAIGGLIGLFITSFIAFVIFIYTSTSEMKENIAVNKQTVTQIQATIHPHCWLQ